MIETVIEKKVFRIPYAPVHRCSIDENKRRLSEPQRIGEILPGLMADIKKRTKRPSFRASIDF